MNFCSSIGHPGLSFWLSNSSKTSRYAPWSTYLRSYHTVYIVPVWCWMDLNKTYIHTKVEIKFLLVYLWRSLAQCASKFVYFHQVFVSGSKTIINVIILTSTNTFPSISKPLETSPPEIFCEMCGEMHSSKSIVFDTGRVRFSLCG